MFDRGARALRSALGQLHHVAMSQPVDEDAYVCPLCLHGFRRDQIAELTREHSPPIARGGAVVTLTCRWCNNDAGPIQAQAAHRDDWLQFAAGVEGTTRSVRLNAGDNLVVTADVEHRDGSIMIFVDDGRSAPAHHSALRQGLRDGIVKNFTMIGNAGFRRDHAEASAVRDAYLAAFALLGYRFILWPDLDPFREWIRTGTRPDTINERSTGRTPLFDDEFRGLLTISSPIECVCVVVPGREYVMLPWPNKVKEHEEWLRAGAPLDGGIEAKVHEWTSQMPMLLDLPDERV